MRKGMMVTGNFPCIRAGRTTEALSYRGWEHDVLCMHRPAQMVDVYKNIIEIPSATDEEFIEEIQKSDAEIFHVHNEPNWPVLLLKEATDKPVILNVHDVASARKRTMPDIFEIPAYEAADGLIFVTDEQRDFVLKMGAKIEDTPYAVIGNYGSSSYFVEKRILPMFGDLVYEGGLNKRGSTERWRDQSEVADFLTANGIDLHFFSDTEVDYGVYHGPIVEFGALVHQMSRFRWGFCGNAEVSEAWNQTIPNKFFDYLAAGIPVIAYNCELMRPYCEMGFGIYCDSLDEVKRAVLTDEKKYKKYVMENRGRFTFLNHIQSVVDLYDVLGGN